MPLQFLTGLFGMNFVNGDGAPGDPMLLLGTQGYVIFWVLGVSLTIVAVWAFRHGQKVLNGTGKAAKRIGKAGRQVGRQATIKLRSVSSNISSPSFPKSMVKSLAI